jgi:hypothetical protein
VISFETQPAEGAAALQHLVALQTEHGGSLDDIVEPVRGSDPLHLEKPDFAEGGAVVWARVAPDSDTRAPFLVRWTNNLTVFDTEFIRNDVALDQDIIWDNQDDEFMAITLTLKTTGIPSMTTWGPLTIPVGDIEVTFRDFNEGEVRYVKPRNLFPTVRFLSDEELDIGFKETDDTFFTGGDDNMGAFVHPLEANEPGAEAQGVIQVIQEGRPGLFSGRGRYQIYGLKRHFGINLPPACPDP